MIAKGHDFRRITLVAAVQPDGALFSSDFRAAERLFCLLMQAAGRAGRDADYVRAHDSQPEMWVQSFEPQHSVYAALRKYDYPAFAALQLRERQEAGMPPLLFRRWCVPMPRHRKRRRPFCARPQRLRTRGSCRIWKMCSSIRPSPWPCSVSPMWSVHRC